MRLYKMQIIGYPKEAYGPQYEDPETKEVRQDLKPDWKPEGWSAWVDEMANDWGQAWARDARDAGYKFFWPSQKRTYLTKEAAESKAWLVRKWGGTAVVLEAEVGEFVEVGEAHRLRLEARDKARAQKLREKAAKLTQEAKNLETRNADVSGGIPEGYFN